MPRVIKAFPPNYSAIRRAFPHIRGRDIIFSYGDRIYYPSGAALAPELLAHEEVHCRRQAGDPAAWWARYIEDANFRLDEEVLAHRAEYQALRSAGAPSPDLEFVINRLRSPLYGAKMTLDRARELVAG